MEVFSPAPPREGTPAALQQQQFVRPSQPGRHISHDPLHSRQPLAEDAALPEHCIRICLSGNKSSSNGDDPVQKFLQSSLNFQIEHSTEKSVMKYVKDVLRDSESRVGCNPSEVSYRRIDISVVIGTPDAIAKCTPKQSAELSAMGSSSNAGVKPEWFTYQPGNMLPAEVDRSDAQFFKTEQNIFHGPDIGNHIAEQDPTLGIAPHEAQQPFDPLVDPRLCTGSHTINGIQTVHSFARPNSLHNPPPPYQRSQISAEMAYALQRDQNIPPDQFELFGGGSSRTSSMGPPGNTSAFASMDTQPGSLPAHMDSPFGASLHHLSARSRSQTPVMKIKKSAPARQRPRKNPKATGRNRRVSGQELNEAKGSTSLAHGATSGETMSLATFADLAHTDYPLDMKTTSGAGYGLICNETNEDRECPKDTTMPKHENPEEYAVKEFLPPATRGYSSLYLEEDMGIDELNPYST